MGVLLQRVHVYVVCFAATQVKRKAWAGEYQLLYITPELATNNTAALQQLHATHRIGLIAIDEAHCVSEWWVLQANQGYSTYTAAQLGTHLVA
jgi:hypothetical protein